MENLKNKSHFKTVVFTMLTWAVLLSGINFICGLIVKNRYIAVDPIDYKTALSSWGYFNPNQEKLILFPGIKEYKVTINSLGLRSTAPEDITLQQIKDRYRILAIGDSITFGQFVDDEDTYPYQLGNILQEENKNAVVLNAGVGWSTITDFLYYLKIKGLGLKPHLVVLSFCENDLHGLDDEPVYERLKKSVKFSVFKTIKLANFMRIFRKAELQRRYARSTNKIKDVRVREILLKKSKNLDDILYVQAYEGELPAMDPRHKDLEKSWQKYFANLDEIIALLQANHIDFVFVIYPNIVTVFDKAKDNYQDILIEYLSKKKVEYVDLLPLFKQHKDQYLTLYHDLPRDFHLGNYGNKLMAEAVYNKIRERIH